MFGVPLDDWVSGGYVDVYSRVVSVVLVLWGVGPALRNGMKIRKKKYATLLQESEISSG